MSNNGFEEMAAYTSRLTKVNPEKVSKESILEAANFFLEKLIPVIPKSLRNKKHMRDHVKIEVEDDKVIIYFDETSYYWRFAENGTSKIQAVHFVESTWQQNKEMIENIMTQKLLKEMEG